MSQTKNKLLLLTRSNPVCPNCVVMKNMLDGEGVEYEELDIALNPEAVEKYGISSVPVSIIVDEVGEEVVRFSGFRPPSLITGFL